MPLSEIAITRWSTEFLSNKRSFELLQQQKKVQDFAKLHMRLFDAIAYARSRHASEGATKQIDRLLSVVRSKSDAYYLAIIDYFQRPELVDLYVEALGQEPTISDSGAIGRLLSFGTKHKEFFDKHRVCIVLFCCLWRLCRAVGIFPKSVHRDGAG
jgi:hypothetical protein